MSTKNIIGIIAVSTLVFLTCKVLFTPKLIGSSNGNPENSKIDQGDVDMDKISLQGEISMLEAKLSGMIASGESKEELQSKLNDAVDKRKALQ